LLSVLNLPPHRQALQRLEIAVRLKRGLSLILGDVGTGKTTLARALIQTLNQEPGFISHMIFDPTYDSEFQFVANLARLFGIKPFTETDGLLWYVRRL